MRTILTADSRMQALLDSPYVTVPSAAAIAATAVLQVYSQPGHACPTHAITHRRRACSTRTKGVTFFPAYQPEPCACSEPVDGSVSQAVPDLWAAHIHVDGRPRWGRLHSAVAEAKTDRQQLLAARRGGTLDETLARLRAIQPRA